MYGLPINLSTLRFLLKRADDIEALDKILPEQESELARIIDQIRSLEKVAGSYDGYGQCVGFAGTDHWTLGLLIIDEAHWRPEVVSHEVGHALGLPHETVRRRRDTYVEVNSSIALEELRVLSWYEPASKPFDYLSIMHMRAADGLLWWPIDEGPMSFQYERSATGEPSDLDGIAIQHLYDPAQDNDGSVRRGAPLVLF